MTPPASLARSDENKALVTRLFERHIHDRRHSQVMFQPARDFDVLSTRLSRPVARRGFELSANDRCLPERHLGGCRGGP